MYIAQQKRKENICEYLLYMWQVEDLLRATACRPERIEELILSRYQLQGEPLEQVRGWYLELADMMRSEGKLERGHLDINRIILLELERLNRELLADPNDVLYQGLHYQILPALIQLRAKAGEDSPQQSDLETAFSAIYGYLTLRLSGKSISEATEKSMKQISQFLAMLALKYKQKQEREATAL